MYNFKIINYKSVPWEKVKSFGSLNIFQTKSWIDFIIRTQNGEPIIIEIKDNGKLSGYFFGLIIKKLGFKVLGSPLRGWTTSYMGFILKNNLVRVEILKDFTSFVFDKLKCVHFEIMDRNITVQSCKEHNLKYEVFSSFEVDLSGTVEENFYKLSKNCRRDVRRAERNGVIVKISNDKDFVLDYYNQLKDVFKKQSLNPTYSFKRIESLVQSFYKSDNLLLLKAFNDKHKCIATGIFPNFNGKMFFFGGASYRKFQNLLPNEALIWHAMKYGIENNIHTFDMGGGGHYKRKYGGKIITVPWIRKSKYKIFSELRNVAKKLYKVKQKLF